MQQQLCKGRIPLNNCIDALIYFHPKGINQKTKKGFIGSDVQLDIKTARFKHNEETVIIEWTCGDMKKTQKCNIRKYVEPNNNRSLGYHTLFCKKKMLRNKNIITVSCSIHHNNQQPKQDMYTNHSKKRKCKITDFYRYDELAKKKIRRHPNHFKSNNEWRLSSTQVKKIVYLMSEELHQDTLHRLQPTIDCFPAMNGNFQSNCDCTVDSKIGFFDKRYNDITFWKKHIAWAYPQNHTLTIIETIKLFKSRHICGYCCLQMWLPKNSTSYVHMEKYSHVKNLKRQAKAYITIDAFAKSERYQMNMFILYFDFNNK